MADELREPSHANDRALSMAPKSSSPGATPPVTPISTTRSSELSLPVLAALCLAEIDNCRRGEPSTERYGLDLFQRALLNRDRQAWAWVQHCFGGMARGWVRRHPQRGVACRLESEEHYIAQAFERFWQATACNQQLEFKTLAAALRYLRASLHGAILETLRAYQRPGDVSWPVPGAAGEPSMEDATGDDELWDTLKGLLSNPREQRLAYLLFHCGLGPREIVQRCSPEWGSVQEISVQRRAIMERVLRRVDMLRWRLS